MEEQTQKPAIISDDMFGLYFLITLLFPILSFSIVSVLNSISPEWQSGQVFTYVVLFLSPRASWIFFPLIAYSSISLLSLCDNNYKGTHFFVRLGVYTGIVLSVQYGVLLILVSSGYVIFIWIIPFLLFYFSKWLYYKAGGKLKLALRISVIILLAILVIYFFVEFGPDGFLIIPFTLCMAAILFSTPFWIFLIFFKTSVVLLKDYETIPYFDVRKNTSFLAWLTLYAMAFRMNILKMHEIYASLPVESSPTCYIATAAAQGHPYIVRSRPLLLRNGNIIWVNPQLQHFKAVEIAVMVAFPKLHQLIRKIYDVFGKKLAGYIRNPLIADVAFLLLLPVEWVSFHTLKIFVPEIEMISKKIYYS